MKKETSIVETFLKIPLEDKIPYINKHFNDDIFESFVIQKGFEKVYRLSIESQRKNELVTCIIDSFHIHSEEATNLYRFIECFFPVADDFRLQIKKLIIDSFDNSLVQFYYYLGQKIMEKPFVIGTAKKIVISIANDVLLNDLERVNYSLSLDFVSSLSKSKAIERIYEIAIKLGVLIEKYDAICFGRERIKSVDNAIKPCLSLLLSSPEYEYGLEYGAAYNNIRSMHKRDEEPGLIHHFYKCMICRYCALNLIEDSTKEYLFEFLNRQFSASSLTDTFFYFTGDIQSYFLSLVTCIYVKMALLLFCTTATMQLYTYSSLKKEMLWGDIISAEEFSFLIKSIVESPASGNWVEFTAEGIVIGRWQWDYDICISEMVNKIVLNSRSHYQLGKNSNDFGKNNYERIVRGISEKYGWKVVPSSIRKKANKNIVTDVDLIAYNQGIVIIGQIKMANCGRTPYELWKAKKIIEKAIEQENKSISTFEKDNDLLFSILKNNGFISDRNEIKTTIPIIITSSSYFLGFGKCSGIPIVCLDMYQQILSFISESESPQIIKDILDNPFALYDIPIENSIENSIIDQNEFYIEYEEILTE